MYAVGNMYDTILLWHLRWSAFYEKKPWQLDKMLSLVLDCVVQQDLYNCCKRLYFFSRAALYILFSVLLIYCGLGVGVFGVGILNSVFGVFS